MPSEEDFLELDEAALLAQCDVNIHRASGPGGQHRNKVSSAVRLRHRPTGITAIAYDSRSQHANKAMAVKRLRMNIALKLRRPLDTGKGKVPPVVAECIFTPRGKAPAPGLKRLQVGRKDHRFWRVAAFLLDLLVAHEGRVSEAAGRLEISTSNLISVLKFDRHLLAAAQQVRKAHRHGPLK